SPQHGGAGRRHGSTLEERTRSGQGGGGWQAAEAGSGVGPPTAAGGRMVAPAAPQLCRHRNGGGGRGQVGTSRIRPPEAAGPEREGVPAQTLRALIVLPGRSLTSSPWRASRRH